MWEMWEKMVNGSGILQLAFKDVKNVLLREFAMIHPRKQSPLARCHDMCVDLPPVTPWLDPAVDRFGQGMGCAAKTPKWAVPDEKVRVWKSSSTQIYPNLRYGWGKTMPPFLTKQTGSGSMRMLIYFINCVLQSIPRRTHFSLEFELIIMTMSP